MSEPSDYTWYIDTCGDSRTNECITQMLVGATEEAECWEQNCEDGVRRSLWRCPNYEFLARVERHVKLYKYRYALYKKEGKHGKIRLWQFSSPTSTPHHFPRSKRHAVA